jgi:hypothetical protein
MADDSWHTAETFKALTTLAVEGLKFIALINGGAAIAVVAYGFGHVSRIELGPPMARFLIGVLASAVAYVLAYMTQLALYNESAQLESWLPKHERLLIATIISGVVAIGAFAFGCLKVVALLDAA